MGGLFNARAWLCAFVASASACALDEPRVVVDEAADAARRADRDDFLACFTPRSRPILEAWWSAADKQQPALGALAAGDVRLVSQRPYTARDDGPERMLVVVREGPEQLPLVLHRSGGSWRIDLLDSERVGQRGGL